MTWATITDLEQQLGMTADQRMTDALATADTWAKRQRPDLDAAAPARHDVRTAVVLYAALLYKSRSSPQGFDGYSELGDYDTADAMSNVYRLLGHRKPVVG